MRQGDRPLRQLGRATPATPTRPPKDVTWGEATTDEMCIGFIGVTKKGQDLTKPGEKDDLNEIFEAQLDEYRKKQDEAPSSELGQRGSEIRRSRPVGWVESRTTAIFGGLLIRLYRKRKSSLKP